jgi:hypothetical protein
VLRESMTDERWIVLNALFIGNGAPFAGIAASSLYRCLGEVGILLLEVAVGQISRERIFR